MKKKYIQLGAVAFVLLALTGALLLLKNAPEVSEFEQEPDPSEVIYVYGDASTQDLSPKQIDISNEYGDIIIDDVTTADDSASKFTIRGWEKLSLDDYSLSQAVSYAKAMRAKEIISENATADELETFGFNTPRANLTVHFEDGTLSADNTPVVTFGANAPGGEGVYVMLKNDPKIYLISDSAALPYFKPAAAYVNKTITATDPDFKGFDKITLSGANYPETIVVERTPEDTIEAAGVTLHTHAIVSPIRRGIDTEKGLNPLNSVYGLLANDVVAVDDSPETLERYGLNDPAAIVSVVGETPEMTFTLKISDADENGEVHLVKDNSKVIYELSPSALPFLPLSLFDMMDKTVAIPNIKTVSKVIFTTPDNKYEYAITQEDDAKKLYITVNGEPLPDAIGEDGKSVDAGENFRKLYQTMIICRYDEPMPKIITGNATVITEQQAAPATTADTAATSTEADTAEPDITEADTAAPETREPKFLASIEYVYNTGKQSDVVSFYEGPPRKMEIRLNGEGGYYGQSTYLDRLLEDVEKVLDGIAVKAYR